MSATKDDAQYDGYVSPKPEGDVEAGPHHGASVPLMLLITMPRVATQMAWAAQWAALGPYLSTMLPNFAVQLTQLIGPLTGIFVAPTTGVMSDRSLNKMGRRRPFLIYAAVTSCICWVGMGFTKKIAEALGDWGDKETGSRKWTAFFTIVFYIWMDITVNVVQTPAYLLVADFAGDRQTMGAALGQAWSTVGAIIVSAYISWIGPAHETLGYFLGVLVFFMVVTVGAACIAAKETPLTVDDDNVSKCARIGEALKSIFKGLAQLPGPLLVYAIFFFCMCYGYSAYNGNKGQFFGTFVKPGKATGADTCKTYDNCTDAQKAFNDGSQIAGGECDLISNIVSYLFSWCLPFLVHKFGARVVITVGIIPQVALLVMCFCKVVWIDVLVVVLVSLTQSIQFTMIVPVIVHVFGEKEDIGIYVGALNSANCFGMLLNFLIGTGLVQSSMGYQLPVLVGGCVSLAGFFVCLFFFKIKLYSM